MPLSRGSWGNAKTFEFGHKKMGKETPGIISNGVFWKPGQLSFKHTKHYPEIFFRLGAGVKNTKKWRFFGVASKLRVKPKMAQNSLGQSRKIYFIKLTRYFVALLRRYIIAEHLHTGCYSLLRARPKAERVFAEYENFQAERPTD